MVLDSTVIDLEDDTYRITTSTAVDNIAKSIRHVGLINPPVLVQKEKRYRVVAGFRRIAAMRKLNHRHISARVMPAESPTLECIRIAVADNSSQRNLDLLEISRALALLDACIEDRADLPVEAKNLGLPDNPHYIEKIMGICRLPAPIQAGIYQNRISLNVAAELQEFDVSAAGLLARFFVELKVNQNKQKEICSLVKEIARREQRSAREILSSEDILKVMADRELDNLQKTRIVRSNLRRRRFPNLSLAEEAFQRNLRRLNLGERISLLSPAYFEGASLKLSMSFENETEYRELIDILNQTLVNPHLIKIFPSP
jgi:hypothetical protein